MFMNYLNDGSTNFTNVRCPTGARNQVNTLTIIMENRVLNRSKRTLNGVEGLEGQGDIISLKDPSDFISSTLDKRKVNSI